MNSDLRAIGELVRKKGVLPPPLRPPPPTDPAPAKPARPHVPVAEVLTLGVPAIPEAYKAVTFEFCWITPAMAQAFLEGNRGNRKLRDYTVHSYARDMRAGDWVTNHQGIAFYADDTLYDGQHRLQAIIQADRPQLLLVSRGWPRRGEQLVGVADTTDVGAGRTIADILKLQHATDNPRLVTMTVRSIVFLVAGTGGSTRKLSLAATLSVVQECSTGLRWIADQEWRSRGIRQAQVLAALALAAQAGMQTLVDKTYGLLMSGAGMGEGHPILSLRNYLLTDRCIVDSAKSKTLVAEVVATHLKALHEGKKLTQQTHNPDALPWLLNPIQREVERIRSLFAVPTATPDRRSSE